jgi:competence protein ComEC
MSTTYYTTLLALIGGVFIATFYTISFATLAWLGVLALTLLVVGTRTEKRIPRNYLLVITLGTIFLNIGMLRMELAKSEFGYSSLQTQVGELVTLKGEVVRDPEVREKSLQVYVEVGTDLLLVTVDRYTRVAYGDVVSITGTVKLPEAFVTDLGRSFNYPAYLKARGVEYQLAFASLQVLDTGQGHQILTWLYTLKHALQAEITRHVPEPASALGQGLLLGVGEALGAEIETAFRRSGLIHIVVLSGYNIMLIVTFMMLLLRPLQTGLLKLTLSLLAIGAFALMVGLSATVLRASLMAAILVIATAYHRQYLILRVLTFTATVMVCINPWLLVYDIGFQLSFMATLGLVLIAPQLERVCTWLPAGYGLRSFFFATIATQIAVLPILLYQIGEVSLIAVVANVLVLPLVPLAMLLTFLVALFGFFSSGLAILMAWPTTLLLTGIIETALWLAKLPYSALVVPVLPAFIIPVAYSLMTIALIYLYRRHPVPFNLGDLGAMGVVKATEENHVSSTSDGTNVISK